tara:strand:+ start:2961 stop:4322 length:1362 start_codon:yes stop_codon:yes gene_type:complete
MGFFKKIFKGIGKVFRKIGRAIKKGFKKFGKFMGKIGIVGQLAMMFILPGIGGALMKGFGAMAGNMAGLTGSFAGLSGTALGTVVKGVGTVLKGAHGFVQTGVNAFKTVTSGIMEFGKTALNKIPGIKISGAKANFFGANSVMEGISVDAANIANPFRDSITVKPGMSVDKLSQTTGLSVDSLQKLNPNINLSAPGADLSGRTLNLDFGNIAPDIQQVIENGKITAAGGVPSDAFGVDVGKVDTLKPGEVNLNFDTTPTQNNSFNFDSDFDPFSETTRTINQVQDLTRISSAGVPDISTNLLEPTPVDKIGTTMADPLGEVADPTKYVENAMPDVISEVGATDQGSLLSRGLTRAREGLSTSLSRALDDPIGTGLPMVQNVAGAFATPEEIEMSRRGTGYVADVLPQFDVGSVDMTQLFNAGSYGPGAVSMDFLNQAMLFQSPNQRFPGALGY